MAVYPFSAIVGQDLLKAALMICAVAPSVGGVLIRGDKGSAKTTAARGLAELLPGIKVRSGCLFNCAPDNRAEICEICSVDTVYLECTIDAPFINLPLGASEDRVTGSIDLEKFIKDGKRRLQPGLLASANRGILYIDEVNLLADHLVDVLLDVASTGLNTVQRDGIGCSHAAKICLIGTMNEEEGELRPQLSDRFGLSLNVSTPAEPLERAEIVRRRLSFEHNPQAFCDQWSKTQDAVRASITNAQKLLPQIELKEAELLLIARICSELQIASLRADIVMSKVAQALAALNNRLFVVADDLQMASQLVLLHRKRQNNASSAKAQQEKIKTLIDQAELPESTADNSHLDQETGNEYEHEPDNSSMASEQLQERPSTASNYSAVAQITLKDKELSGFRGRRIIGSGADGGRIVGAEASARPRNIALTATVSHSLERNNGTLQIGSEDLYQNQFESKSGALILLLVDASGSLSARSRIEAVQGAAIALLQDAYVRRDRVAVIIFRGDSAEIVLPPTRSVELARAKLHQIQTGGLTPLADALLTAERMIATVRKRDKLKPLMVLLSDGRANVSLQQGEDPFSEALAVANRLFLQDVQSLIVDTESGGNAIGQMHLLADAAGGEYLTIEDLTSQSLTLTIKQRLNERWGEGAR